MAWCGCCIREACDRVMVGSCCDSFTLSLWAHRIIDRDTTNTAISIDHQDKWHRAWRRGTQLC
ncbi:hypothetical protein BS78_01G084700 [Paspalum vaginatum]|nr:hypothetical protein BS78_01G084700 [Paspalum vaginatum]